MQPQAEKETTSTVTELVTQTLRVIKQMEDHNLKNQAQLRELRSLIATLTETPTDKGRVKDNPSNLEMWLSQREEVAKQLGKEVEASLTLDQLAALRRRRRAERLIKEYGRVVTRYPFEIIL